ncbi:MAG: hypothetical protein HUU38_07615 [Anaerolineales bacterium]|nr:hypothetical protein [Anaerolineales bacterium]
MKLNIYFPHRLFPSSPFPLFSPSPLLLFTFSLLLFLLAACAEPNDFPPPPNGILTGTVSVGPISPGPVQLDAPTEEVPAEVYTSRGIQIMTEDGTHVFKEVMFEADGTYSVEIEPDTYQIALIPSGIDWAEGLPVVLTLKPGETTTLDIVIDTGIR